MSFPIFTRRTQQPSTRLQTLAGYLELSAILLGAVTVGIGISRLFANDTAFKLPSPPPVLLLYGAASAISLTSLDAACGSDNAGPVTWRRSRLVRRSSGSSSLQVPTC